MEKLYLQDPYKITFSSLGDKDQKYRKFNQRREKKRDYKDMDEPEKDKNVKGVAQKGFVNFLDIWWLIEFEQYYDLIVMMEYIEDQVKWLLIDHCLIKL